MRTFVRCRLPLGAGRTGHLSLEMSDVRGGDDPYLLNNSDPSMWAEIPSANDWPSYLPNKQVSEFGQHTGQHKRLKGRLMTMLAKIEDEFCSGLSPDWPDADRRMIFAQAILFLMRDDYAGSVLFDAWEIGRVIKMLAVSANIKARWQEVGRVERQIDELIPEMRQLVDRLIVFKALIDDRATWERFEALLPDRFLKAVWRAFNGPKDCPQFYQNVKPHDWQATPKTGFGSLLFSTGGGRG